MEPVVYVDWEQLDAHTLRHKPSGCVLEWFTTSEPFAHYARYTFIPEGITDADRDDLETLRQMAIGYARVFAGSWTRLRG